MIRHLVFYKALPGKEDDVTSLLAEMGPKLTSTIPGFLEFSSGRNVLTDATTGGYTHAICARFADRASLDNRRNYPAHRELVSRASAIRSDALTVDFEE
jgi:hypothetical protein